MFRNVDVVYAIVAGHLLLTGHPGRPGIIVTHEDRRLRLGLKPEWLEVDLMERALVDNAVVASSQVLLLVADKVCSSAF